MQALTQDLPLICHVPSWPWSLLRQAAEKAKDKVIEGLRSPGKDFILAYGLTEGLFSWEYPGQICLFDTPLYCSLLRGLGCRLGGRLGGPDLGQWGAGGKGGDRLGESLAHKPLRT